MEFYNAPAAKIVGGIPPDGSSKSYRLQVGAFTVPRNALNAFDKLKNAGLNPAYEQNGEFYRVVLAGLKANEIQAIAQILANNGFPEAIIREETN
jgi:cell division protein FtsN